MSQRDAIVVRVFRHLFSFNKVKLQ